MGSQATPPLGDTLQRALAATVVAGLRRDPALLDPLVASGSIPDRFAEADPGSSDDPVALLRDLGVALESALADAPGLVADLGIDPLDLLRRDAVAPSRLMAGSSRRRTVMAAVVLPVPRSAPVGAVVRDRRGRLVRRLGAVSLIEFDDPAGAAHGLLDLRDAAGGAMSGAAECGEVVVVGSGRYGHPVSAACRLAGTAGPGELLVTPAFRDPLGELPGVEFAFVAPRQAGDADPMAAWALARA